MEIAFIPKWLLGYWIKSDENQYDLNILLSNIVIILVFLVFKNQVIVFLNFFPHYCLFDKLIGIECPVCGITRSLCEISEGDIKSANAFNSNGIIVAFFFAIQVPLRLFALINSKKGYLVKFISKTISNMIIIILLLTWLLKFFTPQI